MNPETTEILNDALRKAIDVASKTGDFVVQQAPDVVQQLIVFNTVSTGLFAGLGLGLIAVGGRFAQWAMRAASVRYMDSNDAKNPSWYEKARRLYRVDYEGWGWGPAAVSIMAGATLFLTNISEFLKLVLAPKVWLLEYAASLIK